MAELADTRDLRNRLYSLSISGFRGIDQLAIPRLGRVALIAGKNGVGKTTVLDALRVYAARGRIEALRGLLTRRDELTTVRDEDEELIDTPEFERLFHRRNSDGTVIEIGPMRGGQTLKIVEVDFVNASVVPGELLEYVVNSEEGIRVLHVEFDGVRNFYPWSTLALDRRRYSRALRLSNRERLAAPTRCRSLGPGLLDNTELATLWDGVTLTDDEALPLEALQIVFGKRVGQVAAVGDDYRRSGRRVVVKLTDHASPVPLKSLGDGAARMFGVALALANCRDGTLLIDEAENGIHYSLQSKFWNMILRTAEAHNVQVVATTHSKDCIDGFAAAASDCPDVDGNLVRLDRRNDGIRAVDYSKDELAIAARKNIEVR